MSIRTNEEKQKYMQEFLQNIETALKASALEARKIAKETGTPLVIYDKEKGIQEIMIKD